VLVVVGYGQRRLSTRDGTTWNLLEKTPNGGDDNDLFRGVTFANGRFVAVGGSSVSLTMVSTDGATWTMGGTGNAWLGGAANIGARFVAAGGNGLRVYSDDGALTWSAGAGYQSVHYRSVVGNGATVVAVGHTTDGTNQGIIASTTDGASWTERRHTGAAFGSVAYGNGTFVAAGDTGLVVTSADGVSWNESTLGSGTGTVIFDGTRFVLSRGGSIWTSTRGGSWTAVTTSGQEVGAAFNGAYFSFGWPLSVNRSTNFTTWANVDHPGGSGVTQAAVGYAP
jgi:hypothetical protein